MRIMTHKKQLGGQKEPLNFKSNNTIIKNYLGVFYIASYFIDQLINPHKSLGEVFNTLSTRNVLKGTEQEEEER